MRNIITKIEIIPIQIELNEPFVISVGALSHAMNTVVIIHTKDHFGTGECCRVRTIFSETQEDVVAIGKKIAPHYIGKEVIEIRSLITLMNVLHPDFSSIKAAFDIALYDINAKIVNQPLYQYLNGDPDKNMYTDMTIGLHDVDTMVDKAQRYVGQGFPALKIKLGEQPSYADVERVAKIREAVGVEIHIRIDANQGWSFAEASYALDRLQAYNIEYCEAPIHAHQSENRQKLRSVSTIPLMGDECIFSPMDTYRCLAEETIDMVNIKLGKSGGICEAMKIAAIAESAGVSCQVGCFSESRLGITALAHFSMAWDNIIYHDMDSPLMHTIDPVKGGIKYTKDWQVVVTNDVGHGCTFDPDFLAGFDTLLFK